MYCIVAMDSHVIIFFLYKESFVEEVGYREKTTAE